MTRLTTSPFLPSNIIGLQHVYLKISETKKDRTRWRAEHLVFQLANYRGIRVGTSDGRVIVWSTEAAVEQGTLGNWLDSDDGGVFHTPISEKYMSQLTALCHECAKHEDEESRKRAAVAWISRQNLSLIDLTELLKGGHFLHITRVAWMALSLEFCARLHKTKTEDLAYLLKGILPSDDELSEKEKRQHAENSSIFVSSVPTGQEIFDVMEETLSEAEFPTLCKLECVSLSWRSVVQRVRWVLLFKTVDSGLVPKNGLDVTDMTIEPFLTRNGLSVTYLIDAVAQLPKLTHMHAHNFIVNVSALRSLGPQREYDEDEESDTLVPVLEPVRNCISTVSKDGKNPPGSILIAVHAARYREPHVPNYAFYADCTLESIEVPAGISQIGVGAFYNCASLTSITLPEHTAFFNCLPSNLSLISIGKKAFQGCTSLLSIEVPSGVTNINDSTFDGCESLVSIVLPAGLTSIGEYAFAECGFSLIELPQSVMSIGDYAFSRCNSLLHIELPNGITTTGRSAFQKCEALGSITLHAGLKDIGEYAFDECTSLASITLPFGVTHIDDYAFADCSSLTTIDLPVSLMGIGIGVFLGCSSLTTIDLPANIKNIDARVFKNCSSLTTIDLPKGLTSIGDLAFENCSSLTTVIVPSSVSSIGDYAFANCSSLTTINVPVNLTHIGIGVFKNTSQLAKTRQK